MLWLPILFHGLYGLYIWWKGKSNVSGHPWMSNWLYVLQRWTGLVAFIFIAWHLYDAAIRSTRPSTSYADIVHFHTESVVRRLLHHWSHRRFVPSRQRTLEFCLKWGIAVTVRSQRAFGLLGAAVGIAFTLAGIAIVLGLHYGAFPLGGYVQGAGQ